MANEKQFTKLLEDYMYLHPDTALDQNLSAKDQLASILRGHIQRGGLDMVEYMRAYVETERNFFELVQCKDADGDTAVHHAINSGLSHKLLLTFIIANVPKLSVLDLLTKNENKVGDTPLCIAFRTNYHKAAQVILQTVEDGPLFVWKNRLDQSVLHLAVMQENHSAVETIMGKVSDFMREILLKMQDSSGKTPIHMVKDARSCNALFSSSSHPERMAMLKKLLAIQDKEGYTPLHIAVAMGNTNVLEYFLNYAPPESMQEMLDHKNGEGDTVLQLARRYDNKEILALLANVQRKERGAHDKGEDSIAFRQQKIPSPVEDSGLDKKLKPFTRNIKKELVEKPAMSDAGINTIYDSSPDLHVFQEELNRLCRIHDSTIQAREHEEESEQQYSAQIVDREESLVRIAALIKTIYLEKEECKQKILFLEETLDQTTRAVQKEITAIKLSASQENLADARTKKELLEAEIELYQEKQKECDKRIRHLEAKQEQDSKELEDLKFQRKKCQLKIKHLKIKEKSVMGKIKKCERIIADITGKEPCMAATDAQPDHEDESLTSTQIVRDAGISDESEVGSDYGEGNDCSTSELDVNLETDTAQTPTGGIDNTNQTSHEDSAGNERCCQPCWNSLVCRLISCCRRTDQPVSTSNTDSSDGVEMSEMQTEG